MKLYPNGDLWVAKRLHIIPVTKNCQILTPGLERVLDSEVCGYDNASTTESVV